MEEVSFMCFFLVTKPGKEIQAWNVSLSRRKLLKQCKFHMPVMISLLNESYLGQLYVIYRSASCPQEFEQERLKWLLPSEKKVLGSNPPQYLSEWTLSLLLHRGSVSPSDGRYETSYSMDCPDDEMRWCVERHLLNSKSSLWSDSLA